MSAASFGNGGLGKLVQDGLAVDAVCWMGLERITVDPAVMGGLPCIRGLRVTVAMVLGQLAAGQTPAEILADYPYLEAEDVTAALQFGAARVNEREIVIAQTA